tara:strand:- start:751 stop:1077 length:327 start_codon:yes stop_codon:yes gene_type:complete
LSKSSFWNSSLRGWFYFNPKKNPRIFQKISQDVDLFFLKEKSSEPRLGIVIPKKYGNAVKRNKMKRKIRFWFWKNSSKIQPKIAILRMNSKPSDLDFVLRSLLEHWKG